VTVTAKEVAQMREFWGILFPDTESPSPQQWALWSLMHDTATIRKGLVQLSAKYRKLNGQMDGGYMARFLSSVLNRISRSKQQTQDSSTATAKCGAVGL
jgi:hypothetical protein